nr:uncharacterized protein LOC103406617 [Ipomoea batatas]
MKNPGRRERRCARDASSFTLPTPTPLLPAAFILHSSSVAVTMIRKGTMSWDPMTLLMLPSFMTVVVLKILRHLAVLQTSIFHMMMNRWSFIIYDLHCELEIVAPGPRTLDLLKFHQRIRLPPT